MEARPVVHPSADTLRAYGLGKLDDAATEDVLRHLEACADCRRLVAELSADSFLGQVRNAQGGPAATPTPGKSLSGMSRSVKDTSPGQPAAAVPPELAGHPQYEVIRQLGGGGMGVVYLARNRDMDRLEALKVVNQTLLARPGALERFQQEIRAAAQLSHPNIVTAYSVLRPGALVVLSMEYVDGQDLAAVVKRHGPLPVTNACYYVQQAALGLQHAFEKDMVHRDIKPGNLILARGTPKHRIKILDFGLAKAMREKPLEGGLTSEGQMLGTPEYMAPEQTRNAQQADIRADIYSLGCTLYCLLSGGPPFRATNLLDLLQAHQSVEARPLNVVRPEVTAALAAVVARMMAKDPAQRYQQPVEVVQGLAQFLKSGAKETLAGEGSMLSRESVGVNPRAATEAKASAVRRDTLRGSGATSFDSPKSMAKCQARSTEPASRKTWIIGAAVAVGVLLLGLVGLWAAGVIKLRTPHGTIVLENVPADAEVLVDGEKATVTMKDGQTIEISVAAGKTQRLQVKKDGNVFLSKEVEIAASGRPPLIVRLEPQVAPAKPVEQPQALKKPTSEYDELATGNWVAALPSEQEFNRLRTEKAYWGAEPRFVSGILECNHGGLRFHPLRAKDAIIRAQVKKVERTSKGGINVSLVLRDGNGNQVAAWCNGDGWFGIGRRRKDRDWECLKWCILSDRYDGYFFEFAFAAVRDKLSVYVKGRKILEARDDESTEDRGGIGVNGVNCRGLFRDIEVQVLDK
jgi:anti-sigma factor RsiW